jgi:hypothetical protein
MDRQQRLRFRAEMVRAHRLQLGNPRIELDLRREEHLLAPLLVTIALSACSARIALSVLCTPKHVAPCGDKVKRNIAQYRYDSRSIAARKKSRPL